MVVVLKFKQSPPAVGVSVGREFKEQVRATVPEAKHLVAWPGNTTVLSRSLSKCLWLSGQPGAR